MELQLQLALSLSSSSSSSSSSTSHLDLNHDLPAPKPMEMEEFKKRKLCVHGDDDEDEDGCNVPQTLPLLFCNQQLHEDDDDVQSTFISMNHKNREEKDVIGWPPVKSNRKRLCHQKNGGGGGGNDNDGKGSKSMYVKAQMEGVGIARKIDLNLHHSYNTLAHTLAHMFGKRTKDVELTYQDKEGDWLLAGDVPWGTFMKTVQRLKLRKNSCLQNDMMDSTSFCLNTG